MNNLKIARDALIVTLCAGALILVACSNPAGSSSLSEPDTGVARIIIAGPEEARTVLPGMTNFVKYTVNFVHEDGASKPLLILDAETPASKVELKPGKWTVIIGGWVATDISTGDGEDAAKGQDIFADLVNTAEGSAEVIVLAGKTVDVHLTLNKKLDETEGNGDLTWDISFPTALVGTAKLTLSRLEGTGNFTLRKTINLKDGAKSDRHQGSETLSAGYYRADVTIAATHFIKSRSIVAYIYPRLETRLQPIEFKEADIPAPPALPPVSGSVAINIGVKKDATMNITYEPSHGEGEAVILSTTGEDGYPAELTVSVAGFNGVLCLIDGVEMDHVNENTERFVIRAAELEEGSHYLTVIGINADKSAQSEELSLTVIAASSGQGDDSADSAVIKVDNVAALATALNALPENTAATAYPVKLSGITISSNINSGNTLRTLYDVLNRYVTLDLRDCTVDYFNNCSTTSTSGKAYVVTVRLGQSVNTIADHAFVGCVALVKVELPGVTAIGTKAFANCAALEEITFGSTPPSLGALAIPVGPVFAAILVPNGAAQAYQSSATESGWTEELKALVQEISNE
jgi:hypothetical protein